MFSGADVLFLYQYDTRVVLINTEVVYRKGRRRLLLGNICFLVYCVWGVCRVVKAYVMRFLHNGGGGGERSHEDQLRLRSFKSLFKSAGLVNSA